MAKFVVFEETQERGDIDTYIDFEYVHRVTIFVDYEDDDAIKIETIYGDIFTSKFDKTSPKGERILSWLSENGL